MRQTGFCSLLVALALAAPVSPAFAGSANGGAKSPHRQTGPQLVAPGTSGRSLSRRLRRSGGVLHPPPLAGSSMPVIPPPGTPGGNPNVQPK